MDRDTGSTSGQANPAAPEHPRALQQPHLPLQAPGKGHQPSPKLGIASGDISTGGCGQGKHGRDQNDCRASPRLPKSCRKRSQPVWTEGSAARPAPLPSALPGASTGSCSGARGSRHQPRFILLIAACKSHNPPGKAQRCPERLRA